MSANSTPKYGFYERVIIHSPGKPVHGRLGAILGRSRNHDGGWGYAVHVYETEITWDLSETELRPTGEFDVKETFYDGTTIEVEVDDRGRGWVRRATGDG